MSKLIKETILRFFRNFHAEVPLENLDDAGVVNGVVFSTDSFTVKPYFFPGGDIGKLAACGTVNDISCLGAEPAALSSALVIEEGFPLSDLERILDSIAYVCREAGIGVVTGDTKVVEKGALDKIIINTSGIGFKGDALENNLSVVRRYRSDFKANWLLDSNVRPGDKIIVSGTIGDHGAALMSLREGYGLQSTIVSDVAPLNRMIKKVLLEVGGVVSIKDPTRGGLANLLNEWSEKSNVGIKIKEPNIPIKDVVKNMLELLGIDPLEVGSEGKVVFAVIREKAEEVLELLRSTNEGRDAAIIGEATDMLDVVVMETAIGGRRLIPPPLGDPVPRIC